MLEVNFSVRMIISRWDDIPGRVRDEHGSSSVLLFILLAPIWIMHVSDNRFFAKALVYADVTLYMGIHGKHVSLRNAKYFSGDWGKGASKGKGKKAFFPGWMTLEFSRCHWVNGGEFTAIFYGQRFDLCVPWFELHLIHPISQETSDAQAVEKLFSL